jgi:fused signal recognition particle receptor
MIFGFFKKSYGALASGLSKTKKLFRRIFKGKISEERLDELEEIMLKADMGPRTAVAIVDELRDAYADGKIKEMSEVRDFLGNRLVEILAQEGNELNEAEKPPTVEIWANRVGVEIVKHKSGADPAAVCFDAADAAIARGMDVLIVDTAGRLHTQTNLMKELNKIRRVVEKKIPGAPHEVLLVLDATVGQNGLVQSKEFSDAIQVTGLVLAKLDGTAKGGIVVSIKKDLDIPVKLIGVGEKAEDLQPFDPADFVEALLEAEEE